MKGALRILAVDNEPSVTFSLQHIFTAPRYSITIAGSGAEALTRLEASPDAFDVIIVDQKMPELTGLELVTEIKQRGFTGQIVVISAHLSSEIRDNFEQMGVRVLFAKPFDIVALRNAVDLLAAA